MSHLPLKIWRGEAGQFIPPLWRILQSYPLRKRCRAEPKEEAVPLLSYDFNILVDFIEKLDPCEEEMLPEINVMVKKEKPSRLPWIYQLRSWSKWRGKTKPAKNQNTASQTAETSVRREKWTRRQALQRGRFSKRRHRRCGWASPRQCGFHHYY